MAYVACQSCGAPVGERALCPECLTPQAGRYQAVPLVLSRALDPSLQVTDLAEWESHSSQVALLEVPDPHSYLDDDVAGDTSIELDERLLASIGLSPTPPPRDPQKSLRRAVSLPKPRKGLDRVAGRRGSAIVGGLMSFLNSGSASLIGHAVLMLIALLISWSTPEVIKYDPLLMESSDDSARLLNFQRSQPEQDEVPAPVTEDLESQLKPVPIVTRDSVPAAQPESLPMPIGGMEQSPASDRTNPIHKVGTSDVVTLSGRTSKPGAEAAATSGSRSESGRIAGAKKHGGGKDVIDAVDLALKWLAAHQLPDGSWNADGTRYDHDMPQLDDPARDSPYDIGVSSLCLLAFMGAGHTTESGEHKDVVKRGLKWLLSQQNRSFGDFPGTRKRNHYARTYNSATATLVLAEAALIHEDNNVYLEATRRALRFWTESQNANGGWSYYSGERSRAQEDKRSDTSITGWVVLAMVVAKEAGLEVSPGSMTTAADLYGRFFIETTGETNYADDHPYAGRTGPGIAGVGLASRRLLDPTLYQAQDRLAVSYLLKNVPSWQTLTSRSPTLPAGQNLHTLYGWYAGTMGMFYATGGEGRNWDTWNNALKKALLPNQIREGANAGSWNPHQPWIGALMGRVYATAMNALTLEVYYRYTVHEERIIPPLESESSR